MTSSERLISYIVEDGQEITEYNYTDAQGTDPKGTGNNPIMVATARQFLEAMTWEYYLDIEKDGGIVVQEINDNKIRLIKDIDFSEIVNASDLYKLQSITFTGTLDGNGMNLNNVRVLSSVVTENLQQSFGMLYKVGLDDDDYQNATLKTVIKKFKHKSF